MITKWISHVANCLLALSLLANLAGAVQDPSDSSGKESELLALLRSDAAKGEKAIACKLLAIHGSSAAVSDLAKLLPDPELSSWARIALEAIPGSAADAALRDAAGSLEGKLLVGTLNSIGVRRDAQAVDLLATRLRDSDDAVASAAAVALGRIGNAAATKSLRSALTTAPQGVRSAIAEGCILCAERLWAEGNAEAAVEIYDQVRNADLPKPRIIEATRGAILARNRAGIPLLVEQLRSPDKALFQLALTVTREFPGGELDAKLAAELPLATPDRGALIVQAMADRPETVDLPTVLAAAGAGPMPVRLSAIAALGKVGDASCLTVLLEAARDDDSELSEAARTSLAALPGEKVDAQIAAMLPRAKGPTYPLLIEVVGQRRIEATGELLKALDSPDKAVRGAALTALGETIALKNLSVLISQAVAPQHPSDDAEIAQQALRAAAVRMPDREACAAELASALQNAPDSAKGMLLEILGDVGGSTALKTIGAAAKSSDPQLQDVGSRLLGKWNSVDAAPVLLDLATSAPTPKYQVRALRGYIGLARKFDMPEQERVEMCRNAYGIATQPAERQLVLEVLKIHPSGEALSLAIQAMKDPELKAEATEATLTIAQQVGGKELDVQKLLTQAGFEKVELVIDKAQYGVGSTLKDVTAVLQKHAGDLPLITLPSNSYNASFEGDPVPGSVKRLRIWYHMNGRAGEATFAENAVIILPMPK